MKTFKQYLKEADSEEVRDAKKVFTELQGMYSKIPKFPLVFKNLKGKGSGYLETSKLKVVKSFLLIRWLLMIRE